MRRALCILAVIGFIAFASDPLVCAQKPKPVRIGVTIDGPWERNQEILDLLQKGLKEVLENVAPVEFPPGAILVGDWTLPGVRKINDRLLADPGVDLLLGLGLITSQDLCTRGSLPKPVVAPVVVDVARQRIPMKNGTSGIRNLNYLVYPTTFERDINLFREVVPIKKLVNVSSKRYADVLQFPQTTMLDLGRRLGLEVTQLYLDVSADEVLNALPKDADAVYLEPTLHLAPGEFTRLVRGFIERRLPSFSFFGETEVRQGIMASANPDIFPRLVRRIALNVQRILGGEEPGALSVVFTPGKRLTINLNTAYAVGVAPKWNTLLEAELVGVDTAAPGALWLTLGESIRRFAEQNLDVQAKIREVDAEANTVAIARSNLLPKIDLGVTGVQIDKDRAQAGGQPERSGSMDVGATQVIFSEPALANLSIQSSLQDSRVQDLEITRLNTILDGSTYFINYLRARKLFFILLDNLKLTRTNLELARVRQTSGAAGQEETLRWEAEIANVRKTAMDAQAQMNQALLGLKQLLNLPLVYQVNVADVSLEDSSLLVSRNNILSFFEDPVSFELLTDFLASEGGRRAPELRQLDAVIAAQERTLTSTRLSYFLPTISAFGKYTSRFYKSEIVSPFQLPSISAAPPPSTPGEAFLYQLLGGFSVKLPDDRDWSVGLQLSLNLFNGFSTKASDDRAALNLERYRVQKNAAEQKVALRIRAEMEKAKASHFSIQQAKLEQDAARKTLDIVTDAYSRGAVSILSLLDAQNSALRANQVSANALYDFFIDYLSLQRSIGKYDVLMTSGERDDLLKRLDDYMTQARRR
jgi:outer membrane protein